MEKQTYSYEEAYEESLRYFQGDELAARVWVNKYAVKDFLENFQKNSQKKKIYISQKKGPSSFGDFS